MSDAWSGILHDRDSVNPCRWPGMAPGEARGGGGDSNPPVYVINNIGQYFPAWFGLLGTSPLRDYITTLGVRPITYGQPAMI